MARNFLTAINLNKNELQNAAVQNLAAAPSSPVKGQLYFDSTGNILYWWNGTGWVAAQGGAGAVPATTVTTQAVGDAAVVGVATTYAREDHKHGREAFGAITAQTAFGAASANGVATTLPRSDHVHGTPVHDAAAHSTFSRSVFAAPTADVPWGGFKITGLADPTVGTDAANKQYVDNSIAGLSWKEAVRLASTVNLASISGPQTIDGVATSTGDRVLLKNQTTGTQNGIYIAAPAAWARATDADAVGELDAAAVYVSEGTTQGDTSWSCTTDGPITPGATATVWAQFAGGGAVTAGAGMTQTGNTLNVIGDASITVAADAISRAALTGDVTAPAGSNATTLAFDVVSNAHIVNVPTNTVKGRILGGTGDPTDLTVANLATMVTGTLGRLFSQATVGGATSQVITHNLNTQAVLVNVFRTLTPWDTIECDVERTTVNTVTLRFAVAPATNEYSVVVIG